MDTRTDLIDEYLRLTRDVMPSLAKHAHTEKGMEHAKAWPVKHDHCFQRIVLDNICEGAWYEKIQSPAYQHLTAIQAQAAVILCRSIISGEANLKQLNERFLRWRQRQHSFNF